MKTQSYPFTITVLGHLNCSELVEDTGGLIDLDKLLCLGDPFFGKKEIIGNESQERMGLLLVRKTHLTNC
jgi:phosphoribosylformylglycinamidine synthase